MTRRMKELAAEIETRRRSLGWSIRDRLVEFEEGIVTRHKALRAGVVSLVRRAPPATIASAPVIYSMIVPLALLDLWATLYQAICFGAWGVGRVRRADYIALDRGRLAYLNWLEALNCAYCSYGNGVIAYVREIAARTEQYWCPIKHAIRISDPHQRYYDFLEFGDAEGYRARLEEFRAQLRAADREEGACGGQAPG